MELGIGTYSEPNRYEFIVVNRLAMYIVGWECQRHSRAGRKLH